MSIIKQALNIENSYLARDYEVAVIGAGHAGCEAGLAAAKLGHRTVIFTMNPDAIANMPCNPNIGGTAKGQLAREIDALGGYMGKIADETYIQSRMLNSSKGPAVLSPRAQIDRREYQGAMKYELENAKNLDLRQAEIIKILYEEGEEKKVCGLMTRTGAVYPCSIVIVATGTYMEGRIIIGETSFPGGPDGMFQSEGLAASLEEMGVSLQRFKTGTPVRINKNTIDFGGMEKQPGDKVPCLFSFENEESKKHMEKDQMSCWLTWTNDKTRKAVMENIKRSPLFSGDIEGIGPRYCPSIEDKFVKFPDRDRHQIFVEPTGRKTNEMYIQGMSSSMPEEVQIKMINSIPGMEKSIIMRPAYAIEYECIVPTELKISLEHKKTQGLFCAGQINGSSGYEEAAGQGIVAGINASMKLRGKPPLVLDRSIAYIGVLIDDLVTKGTSEPYRMMTSRAEYRLVLRQDNADERLTPIGYEIGLISEERYKKFKNKMELISGEIKRLKKIKVKPGKETDDFMKKAGSSPLKSGCSLYDLLKRPEINYDCLAEIDPQRPLLNPPVKFAVEVRIKYEGYIKLENERIGKFKKLENKKIPRDIDYGIIRGLRKEASQKLDSTRPDSVGMASRISGVSPADISVLLVYLESLKYNKGDK